MINKILLGDCLEVMKQIPNKSVNMVLCDLPYGTTQNKWDSVINMPALWAQYKRICTGAIVLTAQCPFDKVLGASNMSMLKYEWVWEKTRATGHLNSKKQPLKNHENILVFYENQPVYNPQGLKFKEVPTIRKGGNNGTNYGDSAKDSLTEFENYPRSILKIPSEGSTIHPTQKPVPLFEYLIKTYSNYNDTVLDNCMGSGTTAIACINTGRNYIGIERDEKYFNLINARIDKHYNDIL